MEFEPLDGSTVSWSPPDPPNGMIIYYNIRITHTESGELEWFIELFTGISMMSLTMLTQMDTSVYRYMYIMYVKKIKH